MTTEPRLTNEQRIAVEEFRKRHRTGVLALLFTDVVGSTELKRRLGRSEDSRQAVGSGPVPGCGIL